MFVRHNVGVGDAVLIGERSCQSGGTIEGGGLPFGVAEFADFDADAGSIAGTAVIGMISLFRGEQMLHDRAIVDGVMPGDPARAAEPGIIFTANAFR